MAEYDPHLKKVAGGEKKKERKKERKKENNEYKMKIKTLKWQRAL